MAKIVIALGGNALGNTPAEQLALVTGTAKPIVDLIQAGNQVIIAHGNGPQVGMINLGMSTAAAAGAIQADMPFPECGAMSQGYIGYHLQSAIANELAARGVRKSVGTLVTQVLVDEKGPAFQKPSKPVGAFYDKATADKIAAERGYTMVEDAGRGWRQVVPSPKPVDVVEKDMVNALVDAGFVVITVGGGGIPVVRRDGRLTGGARRHRQGLRQRQAGAAGGGRQAGDPHRGGPGGDRLGQARPEGAGRDDGGRGRAVLRRGPFRPGSMLPKVQAAMSFAKAGGTAIIASLANAAAALRGESGTRVVG